ncbi:pyridoxamine 5'-phosphate oxidase family protein [Nostoc sp. UHCC 0302]|uniref:pyridoxamine 5'-phosphate oxidase family protein n=1 Tax=Nostoc sp. UHCC 0302 TaxID=3134896 RepID=UPI00311C970E
MLDIDEMGAKEIHDLLQRIEYGHLGCTSEGHPYVVPMHYYFENPNLYIFTTEGMKTEYIDANPEVCLQVEEIHNLSHWQSVIVMGRAYRITEQQEFAHAMQLIQAKNPKLSPAINRTWIDVWGRANVIVIYRIHPSEMTGRTTEGLSSQM